MLTTPQISSSDKPYIVEYYYKTLWGHADEFINLYKKNHYPVLKKQMELGRIGRITLVKPRFHATEESRWDYRVTIEWKNIQVTDDGFSEENLSRQLFSDYETFKKEELRRFQILIGHWDVPILELNQ
jgi:hypothetical protein